MLNGPVSILRVRQTPSIMASVLRIRIPPSSVRGERSVSSSQPMTGEKNRPPTWLTRSKIWTSSGPWWPASSRRHPVYVPAVPAPMIATSRVFVGLDANPFAPTAAMRMVMTVPRAIVKMLLLCVTAGGTCRAGVRSETALHTARHALDGVSGRRRGARGARQEHLMIVSVAHGGQKSSSRSAK